MARKKVLVNMVVQIGSFGFECPALENFDLKTIKGKKLAAEKSINDILADGWTLEGVELRDVGFHPRPLKGAKKTTTKDKDLTDSDKFGTWWATFSKPYPRM